MTEGGDMPLLESVGQTVGVIFFPSETVGWALSLLEFSVSLKRWSALGAGFSSLWVMN